MMKMQEHPDVYPYELGTIKADGFPGHFIGAFSCHFRLHHHILSTSGRRYRVSTVGLYQDGQLNSANKPFETMVFNEQETKDGWIEMIGLEIDMVYSDDSEQATKRHFEMVETYRV